MTKKGRSTPMRKLAEIRHNQNLTQKQLAEKVGVIRQTIYYYESGARTPRLDMLIKLAIALNCTVADIIETA